MVTRRTDQLLMQIVSEALFERLPELPLRTAASHNRLACLSKHHLALRPLAHSSRIIRLPLPGNDILALSLENPRFVVLLYRNGTLQVRDANEPSELFLSIPGIKSGEMIKMRVSGEAIYVLGKQWVERVELSREAGRQRIGLEWARESTVDLQLSQMLGEGRLMVVGFQQWIGFVVEGVLLGRLEVVSLRGMLLLRSPLVMEIREYLVIVDENKWLKIFSLSTLQQLLEVELFVGEGEEVELKSDPLNQYILLRIHEKGITKRNSLLKINKEYYLGECGEPFFLFDIELGLKQDLILFPTHTEIIQGTTFHSIDMCFFREKEIRIATLVIDINHRTRLYHTQTHLASWLPDLNWVQVLATLNRTPSVLPHQSVNLLQLKKDEGQAQKDSGEEWEMFVAKFLQENMQGFKIEGLMMGLDKSVEARPKCLQFSGQKQLRDKGQNQDALNTMSGSSSFKSLESVTHELEERLLRMIEGDMSEGEQSKEKISQPSFNEGSRLEQEQEEEELWEDGSEYFIDVHSSVQVTFHPLINKFTAIEDKVQRLQDIHMRKLKLIYRSIHAHTKQINSLPTLIPQWCHQQITSFSLQLREDLKQFTATISQLELHGARNMKKICKHYRDHLNEKIEVCEERLEDGQESSSKIEKLMRSLEVD